MRWLTSCSCLFLISMMASVAVAGEVSFTIAGLRVMPKRWDKKGNLQKLERYARQAAEAGAQVVVTPESFLDGYVGNDSILKNGVSWDKYRKLGEPMDGPSVERARRLARELKIYLVFAFPELDQGSVYNALVILGPNGETLHHYRKTHILDERYNT